MTRKVLGYSALSIFVGLIFFVIVFLSGVGWTATRGSIGPFEVGMNRKAVAATAIEADFRSVSFTGCESLEAPVTMEKLKAEIEGLESAKKLARRSDNWILTRDDLYKPERNLLGKRVYYLHFEDDEVAVIQIWSYFTDL